jgi:hypothetical protein
MNGREGNDRRRRSLERQAAQFQLDLSRFIAGGRRIESPPGGRSATAGRRAAAYEVRDRYFPNVTDAQLDRALAGEGQ